MKARVLSAAPSHLVTKCWRRLILIGFILLGLAGGIRAVAQSTFGFDIAVSLSNKAREELHSRREPLVALVSYYGDPTKQAERHADEVGHIQLSPSASTVELPVGATQVQVSGRQVRRERLAWIEGPVMVNVNIVSGRRSSPDNLLSCDIIDGPLQTVQKAPVKLNCSLITEHRETAVRP